ncbi:MAG TPA: family 20 glycosylhydrolase [Puia sp.]|nr:family 20 glycosylhydrolase [Puia sp.]
MKKLLIVTLSLLQGAQIFSQSTAAGIAIIPEPVKLVTSQGFFVLPRVSTIEISSAPELKEVANSLKQHLSVPTGYSVQVSANNPAASIRLILNKTADNSLGNEGYTLSVTPKAVVIRANRPAGLFYGVQSLLQLFPKEIEGKAAVKNQDWKIPAVEITDYPRFTWRGLMFDVSRHFFTKEEVKDFIDEMVKYKYNLLHMHLTDDEGWRVEIKSLPRLTEVGAWNVKKVGTFGEFSVPDSTEPRTYGGFYTQDDIKELVQYAKSRFVDILPEVDVPGHSLSAVVAYPDLSCTPGVEKYRVRSGEKIMNWDGGMTALVDNTLCPANEKVYVFLDKVFTELAQLFPFGYIHVGGDECAKNFWEQSDAVKQLAQKEGLKDMMEVQSYFEKRIEKIVQSKGKKVIGWDEILEGGLAPSAAVMSWRGIKGGIEAAHLGHEVVMSPTTFVYLDYMQSDRVIEPPVYATLRLKKSYEFEPVPDGVDAKLIKGGQANLWTEQVYNMRHLEYMLWPRALAVAECVWSPREKRNWNDFVRRTEAQFGRMDVAQVKYARALYDPIFTPVKDAKGGLQVELSTEVEGLDIYYSFDNSHPDNFYPKYTAALTPPKDAVMLKVVTYRDGKPIGRQIDMPVKELQRRLN